MRLWPSPLSAGEKAMWMRRSLEAQVGGRYLGHLAEAHHLQSLLPASAPSQPRKDGEAFASGRNSESVIRRERTPDTSLGLRPVLDSIGTLTCYERCGRPLPRAARHPPRATTCCLQRGGAMTRVPQRHQHRMTQERSLEDMRSKSGALS